MFLHTKILSHMWWYLIFSGDLDITKYFHKD